METLVFERKKIYDGFLRLLHAWNGLAITLLLITGYFRHAIADLVGKEALWLLHIYVGCGLTAGLAVRALWGLIGPEHARWSALWHPRAWWEAVRHFKLLPRWDFGHHPLASASYLILYGSLAIMAATGLALAGSEQGVGPFASVLFDSVGWGELFEEPHELLANVVLGFVVVHLSALIVHERMDRRPVAQAMISGYQYRLKGAENEKH